MFFEPLDSYNTLRQDSLNTSSIHNSSVYFLKTKIERFKNKKKEKTSKINTSKNKLFSFIRSSSS